MKISWDILKIPFFFVDCGLTLVTKRVFYS